MRPDVVLRCPNRCNLEKFEASEHRWESGQNNHVVQTDGDWLTSISTVDRDILTDARDSTSVLKSAQNLLEADNWNVDSEYKQHPWLISNIT